MLGFAEIADSVIGDTFLAEVTAAVAAGGGSTAFYTRLRDQVVPRILAKFVTGTVSLVRVNSTATSDPLKPYNLTETTYSRTCVVTGFPSKLVDGQRIQIGDLRVLMGADNLAVEPTINDQVEIDAKRYAIVDVRAIMAAGLIKCLYILQVRQHG